MKLTVRFDNSPFVRSHMALPKGRGSWAFALEERPDDVFFPPGMTLTDARRWAIEKVRGFDFIPPNVGTVWVKVLP